MGRKKKVWDKDGLREHAYKTLYKWKLLVVYRKITVREFDIRRRGLNQFFTGMDLKEPQTIGWVALRVKMREKDPDIVFPKDIAERIYRGKY